MSSLRRPLLLRGCRIGAGTRRPLAEREHRLGDLAGRCIGDRSGGLLEDEQPRPGDLARDRLAVADGEERVAAAVDDERGDLDLGQALAQLSLENTMPIWLAIWIGGAVPGVRSQMRAAIARAATGSSPRISARAAAYPATAWRSVQSGIGCANSRLIVAW